MSTNEEVTETTGEATRRKTPLWAIICYIIGIPWVAVALVYIVYRMNVQGDILGALDSLRGIEGGQTEVVEKAYGVLKNEPDLSLQFLIQELQQDPGKDRRMATVSALELVLEWTQISTRRLLLQDILKAMASDGRLRGLALSSDQKDALKELINERNADTELGYEGTRITEVLQWVASGAPGDPQGVERGRLNRLMANYNKKRLRSNERDALMRLSEELGDSENQVEKALVPKLAKVMEGRPVEFTDDEKAFCRNRSAKLEDAYKKSCTNFATALRKIVEDLNSRQAKVKHTLIFELTVLLGHQYGEVRSILAEALFLLRYHKHVPLFLTKQALQSQINPVMAEETAKLTKQEHVLLLEAENSRRRLVCVKLLGRIQTDFCTNPYDIHGVYKEVISGKDAEKFMHANVVRTLEALREDPELSTLVKEVLSEIGRTCR